MNILSMIKCTCLNNNKEINSNFMKACQGKKQPIL